MPRPPSRSTHLLRPGLGQRHNSRQVRWRGKLQETAGSGILQFLTACCAPLRSLPRACGPG
eukprot:9183248-Alexandrium_andersonii.AAC.1